VKKEQERRTITGEHLEELKLFLKNLEENEYSPSKVAALAPLYIRNHYLTPDFFIELWDLVQREEVIVKKQRAFESRMSFRNSSVVLEKYEPPQTKNDGFCSCFGDTFWKKEFEQEVEEKLRKCEALHLGKVSKKQWELGMKQLLGSLVT